MNFRHPYGTIDYRLVKLGMFKSCESFLNFESDSSSISDNDSYFPSFFLGNRIIMAIFEPGPKYVRRLGLPIPPMTVLY